MIVLDEHLNGLGVERAIQRWYRGRVCNVTELRPGSVIKDDAIPHLLRGEHEPTFMTLNWKHFWQRTSAHRSFCKKEWKLPPPSSLDGALWQEGSTS